MTRPRWSIVVPTHNRRFAALRLLRAFERQAPVEGGFEVVVVLDGCTDGTAAAVSAVRWPFAIAVLEQPASGPAAARNRGAARAHGDFLLFLDDDVVPEANVLRAHDAFHVRVPNGVALGDLPPAVDQGGLFGTIL